MNALVSNVLTQVFITLIAVSGIYVLTGLTGMFSLGQAAFMAIGLLCIGAFGHPRPRSLCLGGAAGGRGGNADRLCDRLPRCPAAP